MDFWFRHYFRGIAAYEPDFAALKAVPTRIIPGVGQESRGLLIVFQPSSTDSYRTLHLIWTRFFT
jgi:hypothetical protein